MLLQAINYAVEKGWIVLYVPKGTLSVAIWAEE